MKVVHWEECQDTKIEKFPYKDRINDVTGTSIRWLSRFGDDGSGSPEYGLRFFTIQPVGEIPIHNHHYHQTVYILSGKFECWAFDPETDELLEKKVCTPGTAVFAQSMEPHGMMNIGDEPGTFLCCICNVHEGNNM